MTRKFVVLGGVGAIGRVVVRDLFESHPRNHVTVADFNQVGAGDYARSFRSRRVRSRFADATDPAGLARVLRGHSVVINCTQHQFNLLVMQAALAARVHYIDLGGLFVWTRRQLKLHDQFVQAGRVAVVGMGCAPGITNLLARQLADEFDWVESIQIRVGSIARGARAGDFCFPYSAQTIVEELTLRPWIFSRGKFQQVAPRRGWERVAFPAPVGKAWTVLTRHSEVATLPLNCGGRFCDFKVGFERGFVREVMKRLRAGWTVQDFAQLPAPRTMRDCEVALVRVRGRTAGRVVTRGLACRAMSRPAWQASAGDMDTGCPPSIVAQMLASGESAAPGVWPPELAVKPRRFFQELRSRGLHLIRKC